METKRVAIAELEGAALRNFVLVALGWERLGPVGVTTEAEWSKGILICKMGHNDWWVSPAGDNWCAPCEGLPDPTADWSHGGPLIKMYKIGIEYSGDDIYVYSQIQPLSVFIGRSLLPLVCRAIVASHNPDGYVEVPVELLQ